MITVDIKNILVLNNSIENIICQNVLLATKPREVSVILGANGSGKSTFLKAITNLLPNYKYKIEGSSVYNGKNLLTLTQEELISIRKNEIKYLFQDAINSFDPLKKLDYYFLLTGMDKTEIDNLLKYFYLPDLSTLKNMYSYELSGGMAQRLSFVLALSVKPKLILMDEPTSGVDYAITNLFKLKMKEFISNNNSSIIIVTHDYKFAESIGNNFYLLDDGLLKEINKNDLFSTHDNFQLEE